MGELWLLAKVGMVIKGIVWGGYGIAGGYMFKTGVRYVRDYKEVMKREAE